MANAVQPAERRSLLWRFVQVFVQLFAVFWLRYRTTGAAQLPAGGALLYANHQSYLDPLLVTVSLKRPVSFLARESLFRVPLLGWLLRNTHVMPIRREAAGSSSVREMVRRLGQGSLVGIFPEGTRTASGRVGPLKPGLLAVIRRAKVPVCPVGIAGAWRAFPRGAWFIAPETVRVVFGAPLSPEELLPLLESNQEEEVMELLRTRLLECVQTADEWRVGGEPAIVAKAAATSGEHFLPLHPAIVREDVLADGAP